MKKTTWLGAGLAVLLLPGMAHALGVEAAVGGWQQKPEGTVAYKELTGNDAIDLEKEAKFGEETQVMARLKVDMPLFIPNVYLMATPMQFEGVGQKDTTFKFGNRTFNANVPFASEMTLDHYDVGLYYGIPFLETATLNTLGVDIGIDFRIIDFSARVHQALSGFDESVSETLVVPMVYIGIQVRPVEWLALEGEIRGIAYNANHYYDGIGRVKLKPLPTPLRSLFIAGGFRYENVAIEEKDISADVKFSGPFLEAGVDW